MVSVHNRWTLTNASAQCPKRGRSVQAQIWGGERGAKTSPIRRLARAEVKLFDAGAAGELLDAFDDFGAVHEEFVADDGMGDVDDEAAFALDADGVGVARVGGADEGGPMGADGVFGGVSADLVLREDGLDEASQGESRTLLGTARVLGGDAAEIGDEFFGEFAEGLRLGGWPGIFNHGWHG